MNLIHTKTLDELKMRYLERSIELSKEKTQMWNPLKWKEYRNSPLKKRDVISDIRVALAVKSAYLTARCMLPDRKYCVANVQDYRDFLALDDTDKFVYVKEFYDCDDFAWRLMGKLHHPRYGAFAHGLAWSRKHAFNCFVDWNNHLYIMEPQTDEILKAPPADDKYKIDTIMM